MRSTQQKSTMYGPIGCWRSKLHTQLMSPQMHPEPALGVSLLAAQSPRAVAQDKRRAHG